MRTILLAPVFLCLIFSINQGSLAQSLSFGKKNEAPPRQETVTQFYLSDIDPQEIKNKKLISHTDNVFSGSKTQKKITYNYHRRLNDSWNLHQNWADRKSEIQKRKKVLLGRKIYEVKMTADKIKKSFFSEVYSISSYRYYLFALDEGESIPGFPACKHFELKFAEHQGYELNVVKDKKYVLLFDELGFFIDFKDTFYIAEDADEHLDAQADRPLQPLLLEKRVGSDGSVTMQITRLENEIKE